MTSLVSVINKGTNSVNQMRNVMFLPYDNIYNTNIYREFCKNDREIVIFENTQYRLEVTDHLLSQKHRDILDIIFSTSKVKPMQGERAYVDFSINSILMDLGLTDGQENRDTVIRYLEELKRVNIRLSVKDGLFKGDTLYFNLCDQARHSDKLNRFVLVFNDVYLAMFQRDILVDYNHYLPELLKINNGLAKAFIRYIISNDWINRSLEDILRELEIKREDMTPRNYQMIKKSIRECGELEKFGIEISKKDNVTYKKLKKVYFYNTQKELEKKESSSLFDAK